MLIRDFRFNTYLRLLAVVLVTIAAAGCEATGKPKYGKKDQTSLRLFLEVNPDGSDRTETVKIGRERPFPVHVNREPFLTEANVERAEVVEAFGGFSIEVFFDKQGGWLLDLYTTSYKGKRVAIAAEFGQMRWLGAPVISKGRSDGRFVFVPDASREEAERIVHGLNQVAKMNGKTGE
jgi:hypothetical protein